MELIIDQAGLLTKFSDIIYGSLRKQSTSGWTLDNGMAWRLMLGPPWTMAVTRGWIDWILAMSLSLAMTLI